jgi:Rieske Fe-S protein
MREFFRANKSVDRRAFLSGLTRGVLLMTAVLVVEQVVRFLSFQPGNDDGKVLPAGKPTDFHFGALSYVAEARAYIGHDAGGFYSIDAVCPHLGCLVEPGRAGTFECPCHGSRFDAQGKPKSGPASSPLRHLRLWLEQDGQLMVDRTEAVEPAFRLVV